MKKLLLLLPIAALIASCSKKNDATPALTPKTATMADIVGKWHLATDTTFTVQNGQTTTSITDVSTTNGYFVYNQDGTGDGLLGSQVSSTFTYSVSNGMIKMQVSSPGSTNAPVEDDFTILNISSNTLIVRTYNQNNTYQDAQLTK